MYIVIVGGGKIGYYLSKELINQDYEVLLMEKDRKRLAFCLLYTSPSPRDS